MVPTVYSVQNKRRLSVYSCLMRENIQTNMTEPSFIMRLRLKEAQMKFSKVIERVLLMDLVTIFKYNIVLQANRSNILRGTFRLFLGKTWINLRHLFLKYL